MNRRGFLGGLLAAPAVIVTPGLLMPVKAWIEPNPDFLRMGHNPLSEWPQFRGDGIHDDTAAVQAAIDGRPFLNVNGLHGPRIKVFTNGGVVVTGAIRVTDSLELHPDTRLSGGTFYGGDLGDRPLIKQSNRADWVRGNLDMPGGVFKFNA